MGLSDVSRELFGFDITEFPVGIMDGLESSIAEPSSPTKARLFGSHRRSKSASNGVPSSGETNVLIQQSRLMRELEELVLGFEALEEFAITYEKIDKYVQPATFAQ